MNLTQRWARRLARRGAVALAVALAAAGCGPGGQLRPVSGTVAYKGQPLDSGSVTFLFLDPPGPAGGAVVTDGRFRIDAERGLAPGKYRVQISSPKGVGERTPGQIAAGASPPAKERIPPAFNSASTLVVEVTASGPNEFAWSID